MSGCFSIAMFHSSSRYNAKTVDPDQMSCSAVSDQELHCFPMSLLRDIRHKWIKCILDR